MSPHQFGYYALLYTQQGGAKVPDPGNGLTFHVDKNFGVAHLTIGETAETRLLPSPSSGNGIGAGTRMAVVVATVGSGTCAITDSAGTVFTLTASAEVVEFQVFEVGSSKYWLGTQRLTGVTSSPAELNILDGVGATAAELNMAADNSANAEIVITTNVIAAAESGKTFFLTLANGFTSTLPAPFLGARFRFVVATAPTTAYIITTTNGDNILYGMMEERAGTAGVAGAARDTFNFVANQAKIGDWVEFWSDGTNYYYGGMVDIAAGNTVSVT